MTHQYITVDRKKYAVGLFWQPLAVDATPRAYARNLARRVDRKLNLFAQYRAMVTLGARRTGLRAGMASAAAEVINAFTEFSSFLAVFAAGESYYLVAVRNGIILEDRLFDDAAAARGEYVRLAEIPDWGAFFAPDSWGMPRAVERRLDEIITGRARAVLHPISLMVRNLVSLGVLALFGIGLVYFFQAPIAQMLAPRPQIATINPELAAEYKRQIEEKNKELDEIFDTTPPPPPEPLRMPYDYLPDAAARADLCYRAIGFLMQPVPGWTATGAACDETHATATLRRGVGTLDGFYLAAEGIMPGVFVTEKSESEIQLRAQLPALETSASLDERDPDTVQRDVISLFQSIDAPVDVDIVIDTITNGVDTVNLPVLEIAASSKLTPPQFMRIFDSFGGVYMARAAWNATTKTWNYEVIIYAK